MPPAAVDVRSPIASPPPPPPSRKNPSSSFPQSTQDGSPFNFRAAFGDGGGVCGPDRDAPRSKTEVPPTPPSVRSRPRLWKVRRHVGAQHARSRIGSSEVGLGFNPFCSSNGVSVSSGETGSVGFGFDGVRSGLSECLGSGEGLRQLSSDETGKSSIGQGMEFKKTESVGFVFGAKENGTTRDFLGEKDQAIKNGTEVVSDGTGEKKTEPEPVSGKFGAGFAFGQNWNGLGLNSNLEKTEYGEFEKNLNSDVSGKMKPETGVECPKDSNAAFVFGANPSGLSLNFDSEEGNVMRSSSEFVFGASWCTSESNLSSEKRDSSDIEKEVPSKVEAASKVNTGAFVFESISRKGSSLTENSGNFHGTVGAQVNGLGPEVSDKCKYRCESSDNIASVSSTSSAYTLPDEMRKLNINISGNVPGAVKAEDSNSKPFFNAETASKSRRYIKVSRPSSKDCSSRNVETNYCDKSFKGRSVDVEVTNGSSSKTNVADASGISNSEPFTFQAGLGESADVGQFHKSQSVDSIEANVVSSQPSFSVNKPESQPSVFEAPSVGVEKDYANNSTTSTRDGLGVSSMDFKTPTCGPSSLKESLFPKLDKKPQFNVKNRTIKDKRFRDTKHKLKKPSVNQRLGQDHASKESSSQEKPNSPECYSPMDFSPYQESSIPEEHSRETSATSDGSFYQDNNCRTCSSDAPAPADLKEEDFVFAGKGLDSNRGDQESKQENGSVDYHGESFIQKCPSVSKAEFACSGAQMEQADCHSSVGLTSLESIATYSSDSEKQENSSRMQFYFTSGLEDKEKSFMFSATSSGQEKLSARKHRYRRKSRSGVSGDSSVVTSSSNQSSSSAADKFEASKQNNKGHSSSAEIHETCEKWRLRGNQSYKKGDLAKAEEFYTQGIISVPSSERSGSCLEPLLLCYSNRAAARMCLLRIREAIGDCMMALALDPIFLKAQLRAANCHLVLGEIENALQFFNQCLEMGAGVCLDRRIILDAADGQQKAQKVAECIGQSTKLLEQKNPDAALSALEIISEASSISLYSEKLLKMKAEALIMLRRHEEAIQLCEKSLCFAEKNFSSGISLAANIYGSANELHSFERIWRWCLISKSYFYLGRLEAALPILDKLKQIGSIKDESANKELDSSTLLAVTIRDLLHQKNAGNEAFKSGKYSEAVEHYTVALSSNVESRRFAAICFCNRAAAHQALGQISDAIADCSLAIALDGNYAKAVSRRATLHEMIRDYGQAATDLQRLISILESQSCNKTKEYGSSGKSTGNAKDLRQAQMHLQIMEEESKKGISLDFYLILGSKQTDESSDIKKAYRKAALKHHPDKAGQFLARSDSGDEGRLWKEISQEVHKDADRLFKMIGEAYAILSDPAKRSQYDLDEDIRKASKGSSGSSSHGRHSDACSSGSNGFRPDFRGSPFERSSYRRNFRDNWKTYGNSYSRW
ncbi:uncharacterized protein LOC133831531 [Humulus lupulus]|uniref:uncharacterized protein LOC133831531 n=1 Tax=Humulus lupulus TaxID=3486 RepID=UPI002B40C2E7|nr:uncharacterized protein LOC133831531 [Humulus lupulus]